MNSSKFKLLLIFSFLLLIDQLSKLLLDGVVLNQGISFGWQEGINKWVLVALVLLVSLIFQFGLTKTSNFFKLMVAVFWAGVVGNLIDRFFFGGVRDWLVWPNLNFSNNLADIWITLGLSGIIYEELVLSLKKLQKDSHAS